MNSKLFNGKSNIMEYILISDIFLIIIIIDIPNKSTFQRPEKS